MRLVALVALLACAAAGAADARWQGADSVRAAAETAARGQFDHPGETVRVSAALDDRLQLPACAAPLAATVLRASGNAVTTQVSCASPTAWSVYVVVQVSRKARALVLKRSLLAGETIGADAVALETREVADLGYGFFGSLDEALGQTARRALAAGTVLARSDLAAPRIVRRGQPVTLVGRAGALVVRAEGRALADGAAGDYITVENVNSRRVVRGRVQTAQEVDIDL